MTVQELINKLSSIKGKTKEVSFCYEYGNIESGESIELVDVTEYQDSVIIKGE